MIQADTVLSTAYFPPIDYFVAIAHSQLTLIEAAENYQKQSYRNRANIYSTDGILSLVVPVKKVDSDLIADVEIDYSKQWIQQHERAIISAYGNSPFFEYYKDELFGILECGEKNLLSMNMYLLRTLMSLCELRTEVQLASEYIHEYPQGVNDYRNTIHPKKDSPVFQPSGKFAPRRYYQVFSDKMGFVQNLSILDLLFNEGPNTFSYLY